MSFHPQEANPENDFLIYLKQLLETLGAGRRNRPRFRKALLIGSNYPGRGDVLRIHGCRDTTDMRNFLLDVLGFRKENIQILSDEDGFEDPTCENIIRFLGQFVEQGRGRAEYIFLFCGHAKQKPEAEGWTEDDPSGREEDGKDEYIIPVDAVDDKGSVDDSKIIRDDVLRKYLVDTIGPDAQMLAILDTCHSNTLMDLDHFRCNRVSSIRSRVRRVGRRVLEFSSSTLGETLTNVVASRIYFAKEAVKLLMNKEYKPYRRTCTGYCRRHEQGTGGRVICISACKDGEDDLEGPGKSFTKIFIKTLKADKNPSLKVLMRSLGREVHKNCRDYCEAYDPFFKQSPQISSRTPLNMNEPLFLYE